MDIPDYKSGDFSFDIPMEVDDPNLQSDRINSANAVTTYDISRTNNPEPLLNTTNVPNPKFDHNALMNDSISVNCIFSDNTANAILTGESTSGSYLYDNTMPKMYVAECDVKIGLGNDATDEIPGRAPIKDYHSIISTEAMDNGDFADSQEEPDTDPLDIQPDLSSSKLIEETNTLVNTVSKVKENSNTDLGNSELIKETSILVNVSEVIDHDKMVPETETSQAEILSNEISDAQSEFKPESDSNENSAAESITSQPLSDKKLVRPLKNSSHKHYSRPNYRKEFYKEKRKKKVSCHICGLGMRQSSLRKHVKVVHGELLAQCKLCNVAFHWPDNAKKHVINHHGISMDEASNYVNVVRKRDVPSNDHPMNKICRKKSSTRTKLLPTITLFNCYHCSDSFPTIHQLFQHCDVHRVNSSGVKFRTLVPAKVVAAMGQYKVVF